MMRSGLALPAARSRLRQTACQNRRMKMPPGVPVGTLAIGRPGAVNAALIAASVLALSDPALAGRLEAWRKRQTEAVAQVPSNEIPSNEAPSNEGGA